MSVTSTGSTSAAPVRPEDVGVEKLNKPNDTDSKTMSVAANTL